MCKSVFQFIKAAAWGIWGAIAHEISKQSLTTTGVSDEFAEDIVFGEGIFQTDEIGHVAAALRIIWNAGVLNIDVRPGHARAYELPNRSRVCHRNP